LLQGIAPTGARWAGQYFILMVAWCGTLFLNPTVAAASDFSIGAIADGGTAGRQELNTFIS
jgi:hypothetical protein